MIAIKIDFPAGRWHATAWGSHVNEGVPEWPPCPWRLCRALIAAWHWKHRQDEDRLRCLMEKLTAQPPAYRLPHASTAHTRHYMPVIAGPKETKTKVFDTFIHVSVGESLWIRWDVDLEPAEATLLAILLEKLSYMGRAESLVCASLAEVLPVNGTWTMPIERSQLRDAEAIRLLSPQPASVYSDWVAQQSDSAPAAKKTKGKRKASSLPTSLFDALQLDTADWKKEGWSLPPGSRWVEYLRPRNYLQIMPASEVTPRRTAPPPTVARFAITSKVQPSITQALSLAERFHQALCKWLRESEHSSVVTGLDEEGAPLTGNNHVYFLPECDAHGYITHMTLHARRGFDDAACRALGRLRKVWGAEGFDVNVVLLAAGQPVDFASTSSNASPYFQAARTWVSLTPFIPVRHAKSSRTGAPKLDREKGVQIGSPEHDCWRLLEVVVPDSLVARVSPLGTRIRYGLRDIPCLDFQRQRRTGDGVRAGSRGYALRIDFDGEACLPIGLGYGGHFGLGLFIPAGSA
jgi:CRISPR-associated protein Csb2